MPPTEKDKESDRLVGVLLPHVNKSLKYGLQSSIRDQIYETLETIGFRWDRKLGKWMI